MYGIQRGECPQVTASERLGPKSHRIGKEAKIIRTCLKDSGRLSREWTLAAGLSHEFVKLMIVLSPRVQCTQGGSQRNCNRIRKPMNHTI